MTSATRHASGVRWPHRGVTLVEVLAGLVLLGTVLASVLIARGRFVRQWAQAERQLAAARAADAMLSAALVGPVPNVRVPGQGAVDGMAGVVWRTRWVANRDAGVLGADVARLELFDARQNTPPLVSVDFLLHRFPTLPQTGAPQTPTGQAASQTPPAQGATR